MKKSKIIITLMMALLMLVGLCACGGKDDVKSKSEDMILAENRAFYGKLSDSDDLLAMRSELNSEPEQIVSSQIKNEIISQEPITTTPVTEDSVAEDAVTEDAVAEDSVTEDAVAEDAVTEDAEAEDAETEDAVTEDSINDEPEVIPHTHVYTTDIIAPTCTEGGYTLNTCECGDSYKDAYTDACHTIVWKELIKLATETEEGSLIRKCKNCDYTETVILPKLNGPDSGYEVVTYCTTSGMRNNDYFVTICISVSCRLPSWTVTKINDLALHISYITVDGSTHEMDVVYDSLEKANDRWSYLTLNLGEDGSYTLLYHPMSEIF